MGNTGWEEKQALVVGGGSGIGRATSIALRNLGCNVLATGVAQLELDAATVDRDMRGIVLHQLDVADKSAVESCIAALQRLDILVNAAGVGRGASEFTEEGFLRTLDINLLGTMRTCYAAREKLARRGGSIVNLASVMSFFGTPTAPAYAASKGGVAQLTRSLAVAWAHDGIRVNAVAPGWIDTPMTKPMQADDQRNARVLARTPMGRWGRPEEIAAAITFLCSPQASFVTGAIVPVDGGYIACGV